MHIALVSYVEHQPVAGRVKHPVDGDSQLHHAQIGCQMAAGLCHAAHQKGAKLIAKLTGLGTVQPLHIGGAVD